MSLKEKFLKILYFIPKMYLMLFNFIVDGAVRKSTRFMAHGWTVIIIFYLLVFLSFLITHIKAGTFVINIGFFVFSILILPAIFVFWAKYVAIRLMCRRTFKGPERADEKSNERN